MQTLKVTAGKKKGIIAGLAVIAMLLGLVGATFASSSLPDTTADKVWGQADFTTVTYPFPVTANNLTYAADVAVDAQGGVYAADYENSRVMYYPAGSTTATRVYGQGGNFTTSAAPNPPTADSLNSPTGVSVDVQGGLYVVDYGNERVLYYPAGSTTATRVYGQGGVFNTDTYNKGGRSADSLYEPEAVAVASDGGLYVADYSNSRVLYYPAGSTTATRVYGQGGNFTTSAAPNPPTADSLKFPEGLGVASDGSLYVADTSNNRVLHYPAGSTTADKVYGQPDMTSKSSGATINTLNGPSDIAVAPDGSIYVSDYSNNRVLHYAANPSGNGPDADQVYGQGGDYTTTDCNNGGVTDTSDCGRAPTADSLFYPWGLAISPRDGSLYVADYYNSRIVQYNAPLAPDVPARASDLVPQLRVSPDRVVSTNPENLVSFSFKVKNIGAGNAGDLVISLPVPQGLDVGYLAEGATSGVWVKQVTATTVTIGLPNLEPGKEASGTLVFRPNANAVVGTEVVETYTLTYNDDTKSGKSLFSNHERFVYGSAESNHDESEGAIQRGAAVSAIAGEKVSITQTGYLADELVAQWYTAPNGTSVSLGMHRANAKGEVTFVVNTAGLSGDYAIVGYGNRSEFTQVNILTVAAS